jgi:hypothetical protein
VSAVPDDGIAGYRELLRYGAVRISTAELASGASEIVVVQKQPLPEFYGDDGIYLCAEFANWSSDASSVLRFTRRYGSLLSFQEHGKRHIFSIAEWKKRQDEVRHLWSLSVSLAENGYRNSVFGFETIKVESGEDFGCTPEKLVYRTKSLFRFIWVEFHCIPIDRVRLCRANCNTPYFVATHLGQQYCSDVCARTAQRASKKNWWKNSGPEWRRNRLRRAKVIKKLGGEK